MLRAKVCTPWIAMRRHARSDDRDIGVIVRTEILRFYSVSWYDPGVATMQSLALSARVGILEPRGKAQSETVDPLVEGAPRHAERRGRSGNVAANLLDRLENFGALGRRQDAGEAPVRVQDAGHAPLIEQATCECRLWHAPCLVLLA